MQLVVLSVTKCDALSSDKYPSVKQTVSNMPEHLPFQFVCYLTVSRLLCVQSVPLQGSRFSVLCTQCLSLET